MRHLFFAIYCLSFAATVTSSVAFADADGLKTGETFSSEKVSSLRRVIELLEQEIALLEANLTELSAAREFEMRALEQARSEAEAVQVRVGELYRSEDAAAARLAGLKDQQALGEAKIEAARAAISDTRLRGEAQAELTALQADRDAMASEITELQQERQSLEDAIENLRVEAETLRAETDQELAAKKVEREELADALVASRDALMQSDAAHLAAQERLGEVEAQVAEVEVALKSLAEEETERREALDAVDDDALESLQIAETELLHRLDESAEDLLTRQQKLDRATEQLTEVLAEIDFAQSELADLVSRRNMIQSEFAQTQQTLDDAKAELIDVEVERTSLTEQAGLHRAAIAEGDAAAAQASRNRAALAGSKVDLDAIRAEIDKEMGRLDDLRGERADLDQLVGTLRTELSALTGSADMLLSEQQSAQTDVRAELSDAVAALTEARAEEATRRDAIAQLAAETDELTTQTASARSNLSGLEDLRTALAAEVERLEDDRAVSAADLAALQAQIDENEAGIAAGLEPAHKAKTPPVIVQVQRNSATVIAALQSAPGLPPRNSAAMLQLTELLNGGACPTDALRDTFGTINRQTLVTLIRILGPC